MKKIKIELILPQGALFYQNINLFIYKQYINFLYKLNCFAVDQKCCSCPLSKECYYYQDLQKRIQELGTPCEYFPTFDEIENYLLANCQEGDLLITMGAGDVVNIGEHLLGK